MGKAARELAIGGESLLVIGDAAIVCLVSGLKCDGERQEVIECIHAIEY